jgi:hypothetical protein
MPHNNLSLTLSGRRTPRSQNETLLISVLRGFDFYLELYSILHYEHKAQRFEVLNAVTAMTTDVWFVTPSRLAHICRHFRTMCRFRLQGEMSHSTTLKMEETRSSKTLLNIYHTIQQSVA